jgi:DUF1016 N-terminal domain
VQIQYRCRWRASRSLPPSRFAAAPEVISRKVEAAEWGEGIVDRLAEFIPKAEPGLRGFTRRHLFRMKQFYEAYRGDSRVSPLVAQLPWSHDLIILGQSEQAE